MWTVWWIILEDKVIILMQIVFQMKFQIIYTKRFIDFSKLPVKDFKSQWKFLTHGTLFDYKKRLHYVKFNIKQPRIDLNLISIFYLIN